MKAKKQLYSKLDWVGNQYQCPLLGKLKLRRGMSTQDNWMNFFLCQENSSLYIAMVH